MLSFTSYHRKRVADVLNDEDTVVVTLKDRERKQTDEEEDWYEKAFGPK